MGSLLALPFTSDDLTGKLDIRFDVGAGAQIATVAAPPAGGYYNGGELGVEPGGGVVAA